jgi:uncharacterized membrane protein
MSLTAENTRERPRWRRIALPISIVLNLFFVALIGGHLWRQHYLEVTAGSPLARALLRAEASLPPQQAAAFGGAIRRDLPHYKDAAQQLLDAREALNRQITAEQFDEETVRRALAAWRAAWNHFMDDFDDTLIKALAQLPPDGRRRLVAERRSAAARQVFP